MPPPLVLCYHALSTSWPARLAISDDLFARQLEVLARRGYTGLTLADAEKRRTAGTLPRRPLVITFDDGYASTVLAKPILGRFGFPGTVFVVTSFPDSGRPLSWPGVEQWARGEWAGEMAPLGWDGLASLLEAGWEIGSHTVTHPALPDVSDDRLEDELGRSRAEIVDRLGSCETIAYPYGLADERVARAAMRAGYRAGVTLTSAFRADEPLLRPRVGLNRKDSGLRLRTKLAPAFIAFRHTRLARGAERLNRPLRNR